MDDCSTGKIQELTTRGHEYLLSGQLKEALDSFQSALAVSETIYGALELKISCLLNTGACLVTVGEHQRGISLLESSLSLLDSIPEDQCKSEDKQKWDLLKADHYYNLGLANQSIGHISLAINQLNQSIDLYIRNGHQSTAGDVFCTLAVCCKDNKDSIQQEKTLLSAIQMYHDCNEIGKETLTYSELAIAYQCNGNREKCIQMLTTAKIMGLKLEDINIQGELYSQLGLIYSSLKMYTEAIQSFEKALALVKSTKETDSMLQEANILQNTGAIYNEMKQYNEAVIYHKTAANLYNQLNQPISEAKCLCNLALAQIQLNDKCSASNSYTRALNITPDKLTQFQALEGLGSIEYLTRQYKEATNHFKQALDIIHDNAAAGIDRERVIQKLSLATEATHIEETTKQESSSGRKLVPLIQDNTVKLTCNRVSIKQHHKPLTHCTLTLTEEDNPANYNTNENNHSYDKSLNSSTLTSITTTSDSSCLNNSIFTDELHPHAMPNSTAVIPQGSLALGPGTKELYKVETREIKVKRKGRKMSQQITQIVPKDSVDGALIRTSTAADTSSISNKVNSSKFCILV